MTVSASSPSPGPFPDGLMQLFNVSAEAIALYDQQGRYLRLSAAMARILGYGPEVVTGRHNRELAELPGLLPDEQQFFRQLEACIQAVLAAGEPRWEEHRQPLATGVICYQASYTPLGQPPEQQLLTLWRPVPVAAPTAIVGAEMPRQETIADLQQLRRIPLPSPLPLPSPSRHPIQAEVGSMELLRVVLDAIPQYIFWKDRNSVYLGCNRRWAEMAGIGDPQQVIGLTDADLPWTEEQQRWYLECDRQVMETNSPMLGIKQSQRQANGQITWRETNKLPLHDAEGRVIGLLGTIEDVTERKLAEDLLKQSAAKFRKLAKQEELINQISNQIRRSLKLEKILQTTVCTVRQLFETDRVLIYQFQHRWQGRVIVEDVLPPWRSTLGEMEADNCFSEGYATLYQQGRCRAIANIHAAGLDPCHVAYLEKLEVRSNLIVPILVQSDLWGLLIAHQCSSVREWTQAELDLMQVLAAQVGVAIRQGELYQQARESAQSAQSQAEQLATALEQLKYTQAQLVQTAKMSSLGRLVAGIAHELNNPANIIYGNVSHIESYIQDLTGLLALYQQQYPYPSAAIAERIAAIDLDYLLADLGSILRSFHSGADRIRQVVLSLRNFSRLDEAEMKAANIHEGLDNTLLILQHLLQATPQRPAIEVHKHYGPVPPINCYPGQLNQVFMNILTNAIDALNEGYSGLENGAGSGHPPLIRVSTAITPHHAVITLANNGPAISEAMRSQLFDPFFTTKAVGRGMGLGLSISHQIVVQRHQGNLLCQPSSLGGPEFRIEIPLTLQYPSTSS